MSVTDRNGGTRVAKILVVDDEASIRELVSFTLEDLGHEVLQAKDGEDAVKKVAEEEPDLIVLDVMMPKLDGWGVLRELRRSKHRKQMRVVMLTAKSAENDFVLGWKLGVDDYLTKPFDPDELAIAVNETLMSSPEQLAQKRMRELDKSNLLSRIESAFGEE